MILLAFKLAPALLAGNTVVVKPAPTTPLATLRFGELIKIVCRRAWSTSSPTPTISAAR